MSGSGKRFNASLLEGGPSSTIEWGPFTRLGCKTKDLLFTLIMFTCCLLFSQGIGNYDKPNRTRTRTSPWGWRQTGWHTGDRRTERVSRHPSADGNIPRQEVSRRLWNPSYPHASHRHQGPRGDHYL